MECTAAGENGADSRREGAEGLRRSVTRRRCANCGASVQLLAWHPVAAPDGEQEVYTFCSPVCRTSWERARRTDDC